MSFTVTMPQLGETVTEGTILRWMKQPGDTVAEDDALLEISTDKVDTEVPSPFAGTLLEILVPEGETVAVGTALAVIGVPGEATATAVAAPPVAAPPAQPAVVAAPVQPPPSPPSAPLIEDIPQPPPPATPPPPPAAPQAVGAPVAVGSVLSPVVRRLAEEHGVDLGAIAGSGRGGRITRRDVERHIAAPTPAVPAPTPVEERKGGLGKGISDLIAQSAAPPSGVVASGGAPAPAAPPATAPSAPAAGPALSGSTTEPLSRLRTRIATNMIKSKQSAAHVWTSMEVDFEHVERFRQRHRPSFKEREGFSLTYLPFIARATIDALAAFPVVNSSFDLEGGTRTIHGNVNLGIGVDLDMEGLVVMTIRGADGLRMRGLAREVRRLADKARSGQMEPDDLAGSTFTITNPGPYGSHLSAPIINVPNVAILSTDGIKKRPVVVTDSDGNDALAIHHVGYLGLTWDHRAFDGSTAVMFLKHIKENLETWGWDQELA